MSQTVDTNLGHVSAYAIARAHGFTGTEAEWEEYIANAAIMGQQAVAAKDLAVTAQNAADASRVAAETAQRAAEVAQAAAEYARDQTGVGLELKVDKVEGKGLSTHDLTDELKDKLDDIEEGAEVNVQADWAEIDPNADGFIKNKPTDLAHDAFYVHTDNNLTNQMVDKLDGIEAGAEVNVQPDWNQTDTAADDYIKNKPADFAHDANYVHTDNNFTTPLKTKLEGIETGAEVNVQVDWEESDSSSDAFIQNKPEHLVQDANYVHTDHNLTQEILDEIDGKVDKVTGKGLTKNEFTDAYKEKLDGIDAGANKIVIDGGLSGQSNNPVQNAAIYTALQDKVDKETGKGLSKNDFTDADKTKLDGIATGATKVTVDSSIAQNGANPVTGGAIHTALAGKVDKVSGKQLSTEDFTTDYKEKMDGVESGAEVNIVETVQVNGVALPVSNKTVNVGVPTATSDLTNDSNFPSDANYVHTDNNFTDTLKSKLDGIESGATAVTVDDAVTENGENPVTGAAIYDELDTKVDKVSGKQLSTEDYSTAEKTKLSGIEEQANKTVVDSAVSASSTNPVQNKVIKAELDKKADLEDIYVADNVADKKYKVTLTVVEDHLVETYEEVTA